MHPMLVDAPSIFPHACLDGRQDAPIVDTQIEHPLYGRMYASRPMLRDCTRLLPDLVEELAAEIGWVSGAEARAMVDLTEQQARKLAEFETELAAARPVLSAVAWAEQKYGDVEAKDEPIRRKRAA